MEIPQSLSLSPSLSPSSSPLSDNSPNAPHRQLFSALFTSIKHDVELHDSPTGQQRTLTPHKHKHTHTASSTSYSFNSTLTVTSAHFNARYLVESDFFPLLEQLGQRIKQQQQAQYTHQRDDLQFDDTSSYAESV